MLAINSYLHTLSLLSRNVGLYLATSAIIGFTAFGGIYPLLLNLYLLRLGYGPELIGLVNAAGLLSLAVFSLPAGALGRRLGIRRMLIAGMSLATVGFGLLPLGEFIPRVYHARWAVASYALAWLGAAFYIVNGTPFLMGATRPEERNHAFSVRAALWPLAGFVGSLAGGLLPGLFATRLDISLNHPAPYRYSLLIAALLVIPSIPVLLATREADAGDAQEAVVEKRAAPVGLIALVAFILLLQVAGEGVVRTFFNVYLDASLHVLTARVGVIAAFGQLLSVPAALATPFLMSRWGNGRTFVLGSLGMALSLLLLALVHHWVAAGLGFMGLLAALSVTIPAFSIFSQEAVSPGWRGVMSGTTTTALGISFSAMALGGGYTIATLGYKSVFLMGACLTAAGALLFWACFLRRSRSPRH